jgi:hypothetical protein
VANLTERIGERLTHLAFVDANVRVDSESVTEGSADFGHRTLADVLSASGTGTGPSRRPAVVAT